MYVEIDKSVLSIIMAKKILTIKKVAEITGINASCLTQMIKRERVRPATAGKIAAALDVKVEDILKKGEAEE